MATDSAYATQKSSGKNTEKGFVDKAWDSQYRLEKRIQKLGAGRYARVLKMARKPEPEEFRRTSIIVAIGLGIIGLVGFGIFLIMDALTKALGI